MKVKMIRTFPDNAKVSDIMLTLEKRIKTLELVLQMSLPVLAVFAIKNNIKHFSNLGFPRAVEKLGFPSKR